MVAPVVPYLPGLVHLEELELTNGYREWDVLTAVSAASKMPNLRRLVLEPAPLRTLRELAAHGQALTQFTELRLCDENQIVYHGRGSSTVYNQTEDGTGLVLPSLSCVLPTLRTLYISNTTCDLAGWQAVARILPNLEYLYMSGTLSTWHSPIKGMAALKAAQQEEEEAIKEQINDIVRVFTRLKKLTIKKYVLDGNHLELARNMGVDLNLEIVDQMPDSEDDDGNIQDPQDVSYLESLTPEILQYDERYRYSTEELLELRWDGVGVLRGVETVADNILFRDSLPSELLPVVEK